MQLNLQMYSLISVDGKEKIQIVFFRTEIGFTGTSNCNGINIVGGYEKAGAGAYIEKSFT